MKYAIMYLLLAGIISYMACSSGGWWHVFHWFSLSCLVISAGYAGLGPCVYGKRPDGRIPVWSKCIHLPYMVYSASVWRLACVLSRENPTNRVQDDLVLGRRLRARELPPSVSNYVDLTAEMQDPREIRESASYVTLPILDAGVPTPEALRSTIAGLPPGVTFVHCAQGHGRTGLFALALLFHRRHVRSFEEGMMLMRSARPGIRLNRTQEAFIRRYMTEQSQH